MKAHRLSASDVYNLLQDEQQSKQLLLLDSRPLQQFNTSHIIGSICVAVRPTSVVKHDDDDVISTGHGHGKHKTGGRELGPAAHQTWRVEWRGGLKGSRWSKNCWWDRHVIVVGSSLPSDVAWAENDSTEGAGRESKRRKGSEVRGGGSRGGENSHLNWRDGSATGCGGGSGSETMSLAAVLLREGMVRKLSIYVDDYKGQHFASCYPFLTSKQPNASAIPRLPSEVIPSFLYLGDAEHATSPSLLSCLPISLIITLHTQPLPSKPAASALLGSPPKVIFWQLADEPKADIWQLFRPAFDAIEAARAEGGRVLVHCGAGVSRSAAVCAAYLMLANKWTAQRSLSFLKSRRPKVQPNEGFVAALHKLEREMIRHGRKESKEEKALVPGVDEVLRKKGGHGPEELPHELKLRVMKDGGAISTMSLNLFKELVVGRDSSCDVCLAHPSISRQHASIDGHHDLKTEGDRPRPLARVKDLGSTHGTFLNKQRLASGRYNNVFKHDTLRFGESTREYIVL